MVNTQHTIFRADDRSYFALIKKEVHSLATASGFDNVKVGKADIIISEITSNLSKYANGGEILTGLGEDQYGVYVEIVCVDNGPGIPDLGRVLSDGYSSTSTMGHGLGSVKRLSDVFDIFSLRGWGTIVFSRLYRDERPLFRQRRLDCNGVNIPKTGEQLSGDGYCFANTNDGFRLLIADGLGHGIEAHSAVKKATEAFLQCEDESPTETLRFIHSSIRKTRGVVGVVIRYTHSARQWNFVSVGNIAIRWLAPVGNRNIIAYNGIVGYNIPGSMSDQQLSQEDYPQFIACSDGIRSRWDVTKFPTVLQHHGTVIATALYKEFARGTDDSSIIVCKSV
jgi:anti-sigma regulatory factor (Ser/Thr protein kinase)